MKTLKLISAIALLLAIVGLNACKKSASSTTNSSSLTKSTTVVMKAITKTGSHKSTQDYSIMAANVNIANLQIEENSGNDGENVNGGNNDNGGNDNGNDNGGSESDNGDILLAGPYNLDITGGSASIGQVDVYPGTFKKVDFYFQTAPIDPFFGSSIVINGNYTATDGTVIPYTIQSAFAQQIQLPLAGNGITVTENTTVVVDIVFDVNAWVSGIDFASATITNGEILIDNNNNTDLLAVFEANLSNYIDVEGE